MYNKRRQFLLSSMALVPYLGLIDFKRNNTKLQKRAVILSTWDSGLAVNKVAHKALNEGFVAVDAIEKAGIFIENEISCCVGLGGNPDRDGRVTLDACIMDHQFNCGSVCFVEKIKNPVSLARKVMEKTPHVMLVGEGAVQFALSEGFPLETGELSKDALETYEKWKKTSKYEPVINIENMVPKKLPDGSFNHDTMGTICRDNNNRLAGMCTTSGMAFKMRGRVGDSPIIGSGLFVDGKIGAATASGQGEEVLRVCGTHAIVELIRAGKKPKEACREVIERIVAINPKKAKDFQVGFIALTPSGHWGAYAVQPGFSYAVTFEDSSSEVFMADSYFQ